MRRWALALIVLALASCGGQPTKSSPSSARTVHGQGTQAQHARGCPPGSPYAPAQEDTRKRGNYTAGGLYAPGVRDSTPGTLLNVDCIPEPVVTDEPRSALGNQSPYTVLGKRYRVLDSADGYLERGTASYYGNKFHGRRTSNQEVYDMYAFTAAHKSLPLPSFARVTNLDNGQSVVVRINDRGPFHDDRLIDLSYAAAVKLGVYPRGTGRVEVRALMPGDEGVASAGRSRSRPSRAATRRQETTAMDQLVQRLPDGAATVQSAATMDQWVQRLPDSGAGTEEESSGAAATPVVAAARHAAETAASGGKERRYYIEPRAGQAPSADRFDAWMKEQGLRVATGRPAPVPRDTVAPIPARQPGATSGRYGDAPSQDDAMAPAVASGHAGQWLQVASFASLDNARRALERLSSAGILNARLSDVESRGRTLWRLRVPSEESGVEELVSRLISLGFGQPQIVRE